MEMTSKSDHPGIEAMKADQTNSWTLELDALGGLLSCGGAFDLHRGDTLALTLRLSTGARIMYEARVQTLEPVEGGRLGARIVLSGLCSAERTEFRRWQAQIQREMGSKRVAVEVEATGRVGMNELPREVARADEAAA